MASSDLNYGDHHIDFLEELWGDGYLSPGGPEEVARVLDGIDLSGKTVLDIGCGTGGITVSLARDYGAARVIGIDVEEPVCTRAIERVFAEELEAKVEILQVLPGPIPISGQSFDIVFSKDSIVHIAAKESLAQDAFRLLRPGGWFVASDWLISHDGEPSPEMAAYLAAEDIGFGMASPSRYRSALADAGFSEIELKNRNRWYLELARDELKRLQGPDREKYNQALAGHEDISEEIDLWEKMLVVLESGEHCPHHLRALKRA